jgi:lysozyme
MLATSDSGFTLIKHFEGLRLTAYQDSGGVWTIGYGHTGPDVTAGMVIAETQADSLLQHDVGYAEHAVNTLVTVTLAQYQFDALVDFAFNLGTGSLQHSTLLKVLNTSQYDNAANDFLAWDHVNGVEVNGLKLRREAERDMFLQSQPSAAVS